MRWELVNPEDIAQPADTRSRQDPSPSGSQKKPAQNPGGTPSNPHPADAAVEPLDTLKALIDTVISESSRAVAAEEACRSAEIENARLEAALAAERVARQRLEEEFNRYKRGDEDFGEADDEPSSDALGSRLLAERGRREMAETELRRLKVEAEARRQRMRDELERLRETGVDEESRQQVKAALERLMGERIDVSASDSEVDPPEGTRQAQSSWGAQPPRPGEEPPLPPGWRYASSPSPKPRSRWRRGSRSNL
jgi:hypothetical protein